VTIRESINRKKRITATITFTGFALFPIGAGLMQHSKWFLPVLILGFSLFFGGSLFQFHRIRCPPCQGRIGLAFGSQNPFAIPREFSFCPCCGISLESELETLVDEQAANSKRNAMP
jgi:hypothetical protein